MRSDIDRFIREIGYEAVRHETGEIAYGKDEKPEKYAYREVELCDVIVCIIGGRFGSTAHGGDGSSITQNELKHALSRGIQVFIFVEKGVNAEYETFKLNRENFEIKYSHVDNTKIYEFLDEIYKLPRNNPIFSFETSNDITSFLKEQFAGLFQRFLSEAQRLAEVNVLNEMKGVSSTLQQLVNYLTEERKNSDGAIQAIILANHPAFQAFAKACKARYRIYFATKSELDLWLSARNYQEADPFAWDDDSAVEWSGNGGYMKLTHEIFDSDGKLIPMSPEDWNDSWLVVNQSSDEDEDPPF